jgi:tetratricopeptide (TPR) repeat protein/DNA-directed RNA polymerase subunit RPC12/RpoP
MAWYTSGPMRYLCVHCDHRFEAQDSEVPKRCPACMRAKGVEPVREPDASVQVPKRSRARHAVWLVALALAAGAVVWFTRPKATVDSATSGPAPLGLDALKEGFTRDRVDAAGLEQLLIADDAVESFAEKASAGKDGLKPRAEAVYQALRARARAGAFVPWSLGEPRGSDALTAAQALKKISKDGTRTQLYPLEAAALGVAAMRAVDVPAMVAELVDVAGRKAPLDPSGYLGYFVVAVYPETLGVGVPLLFDVYGGLNLAAGAQANVIADTSAVGAALALRALYENTYLADPKRALASTSNALQLAGRLPSVRTVRGVVVLTERMIEQGLQEFQAARELRADAPRMHNVASVMLVTGDVEKAQSVLSAALEKAPDFASAHATLGTIMMMRGETEEGSVELKKAEQLAPDLSLVQWGLADLALRQGEREDAIARARRALEARPSFDARLRYAALLRQASKYEEMRALAAQLLAQVPSYRKEEVRGVLLQVLGPTALEPDQPTTVDPSADDLSDLGGPNLQLESPQDKGAGTAAGRLNSPSDAPRLQLRDPTQKLQLDLSGK